ncbi:MAG: histidine kinase [Opitutaceae bacterium]
MIRVVLLCLAWLLVGSVPLFAQPLESISEVWELDVETAEQALSVDLEAQVVRVGLVRSACFIYDGKQGIYTRGEFVGETPKLGDIVRVRGITDPGGFNNSIMNAKIEVVGREPLPPATPYDSSMLLDPTIDCAWLAISGRLTSLSVDRQHQLIIAELHHKNDRLNISVNYTPECERYLNSLIFDWVELNVVAGTVYNENRQATGRIFYANTAFDFIRTNYAENRGTPGKSLKIYELMQTTMDHNRVVNTSGFVTHVSERVFYLRGENASIRVETTDTKELERGDRVYIEGYVQTKEVSPGFSARTHEVLEKDDPLIPHELVLSDGFASRFNYDLVTIDAHLVDVGYSFGPATDTGDREKRLTLICRAGERVFEAQLPVGIETLDGIEVGAKLRLAGICHMIRASNVQWMLDIDGLWLELRDLYDIQVLAAAPWWTSTRMLAVLVVVLIVTVLFAVWTLLLRKTVDRQTKIISDKVKQESVLTERQRMARELHDNLDQGLTGAAIQLQATRKFCDKSSAKQTDDLKQLVESSTNIDAEFRERLISHLNALETTAGKTQQGLEAVQAMLAHCAEESRSSILDLRGGLLERMDLPAALREALLPLAEESKVACDIQISGEPRRLQHKAERHLLLVAREAAVNSLRHAEPTRLGVKLCFADDALTLSIEDDGSGFDPKGWDKKGHFGLRGMQERVNRLNGNLRVESLPGGGTQVMIDLNNLAEWELKET